MDCAVKVQPFGHVLCQQQVCICVLHALWNVGEYAAAVAGGVAGAEM